MQQDKARELFEIHSTYVYRIALLLTRSRTMADDAVQETFLRVFQKYHTYDGSRDIRPWLYRITVNVTRNLLRKQKWLFFLREVPEEGRVESLEDVMVQNEQDQQLWRVIGKLSSKQKEIVVLHYYAELKLHEIASILGIPLGTCKSRLNNSLEALRRKWREGQDMAEDEGGYYIGEKKNGEFT
ncbi:RNA polymerase subunit sigma-70 [Paenibacillus elgii]|uniref:RNA polymerase subunit sigma-70 n=1 Tax=Paenibacillus elgii TaxID=189691 RepID=A0A2T6G175_9BACL|nr:RNA polymerase subunit sigma-70 [Paenibacillus elgii]